MKERKITWHTSEVLESYACLTCSSRGLIINMFQDRKQFFASFPPKNGSTGFGDHHTLCVSAPSKAWYEPYAIGGDSIAILFN